MLLCVSGEKAECLSGWKKISFKGKNSLSVLLNEKCPSLAVAVVTVAWKWKFVCVCVHSMNEDVHV